MQCNHDARKTRSERKATRKLLSKASWKLEPSASSTSLELEGMASALTSTLPPGISTLLEEDRLPITSEAESEIVCVSLTGSACLESLQHDICDSLRSQHIAADNSCSARWQGLQGLQPIQVHQRVRVSSSPLEEPAALVLLDFKGLRSRRLCETLASGHRSKLESLSCPQGNSFDKLDTGSSHRESRSVAEMESNEELVLDASDGLISSTIAARA